MTKNKISNNIYQNIIDELIFSKCFLLLEDKQGYCLFLRNFNYTKEIQLNTMFTLRTDSKNMIIAECFALINDDKGLAAFKKTFADIYMYTVKIPTNIEDRMLPLFVEEILNKKVKCSYD